MKWMQAFALVTLSSCNFMSPKLDMKDYLFSNKERKWSISNPEPIYSDMHQSFHHEPYSKDGKEFVKVTTIQRRKKAIKTYEIKSETIELVYHWDEIWGVKQVVNDKPWPRFVSVKDLTKPEEYSNQEYLLAKKDSTPIGDLTLENEVIEIGTTDPASESAYVYAKGVGLINISLRYKVPTPSGNIPPNLETRITLKDTEWINCKDKLCKVKE